MDQSPNRVKKAMNFMRKVPTIRDHITNLGIYILESSLFLFHKYSSVRVFISKLNDHPWWKTFILSNKIFFYLIIKHLNLFFILFQKKVSIMINSVIIALDHPLENPESD
jgi:hypothetical protein